MLVEPVVGADLAVQPDSSASESFDDAFWPLFLIAFKAAFRILRDTPAAEDAAAEVLGRLHARWGRLGHADHREAWVVRCATNLALDGVRRGRPAVAAHQPAGFEDDVAARLLVGGALRRLSRRQREAVALHFLLGLREQEVADVLGIAPGTVRRHVARGLQRLRLDLGGSE